VQKKVVILKNTLDTRNKKMGPERKNYNR